VRLYNLLVPQQNRLPIVASLPHSGTYVPLKIRKQFKPGFGAILSPVDWHLDRLYDFLPELGVTVLQATYSRYVVNLNRGLRAVVRPGKVFRGARSTCYGRPLFDRGPKRSEVEERINRYYLPYHRRLARILRGVIRDFGRVYLLDLHGYYRGPAVDVCLGNANETTCSERLIGGFERALCKYYFNVTRNEVWTGGYITRHYGSMDNTESLQIEIRFPAYLEGDNFEEEEVPDWDSEKFRNTGQRLKQVFSDFISRLL
jgi:N-formylglutamate deformylase